MNVKAVDVGNSHFREAIGTRIAWYGSEGPIARQYQDVSGRWLLVEKDHRR